MLTNGSTRGRWAAVAAGMVVVAAGAGVVGAVCSRSAARLDGKDAVPPPGSPVVRSEGDAVRSVYPVDAIEADPLAIRLCTALQQAPASRRATCCATTPGVVLTSECVRTLGAALHAKAATLSARDVGRCVEAVNRELSGCDWVGPHAPPPPRECESIVHGTLATGARCRSSLECLDGLSCEGLGPTTAGRCASPRPDHGECGGSVDPLAAYTRQDEAEARHQECVGWCSGRRCAATIPDGDACTLPIQCGPGSSCVAGHCAAGKAPVAKARKAAGEACQRDAECLGACIAFPQTGRAVCGPKCG